MWLLFKKVDAVQLADPGDQLKQVMTFRQKQIASRELFFKEFIDVDDWRKQFYDCLLEYILSLAKPPPEISGTPPTAAPAPGPTESIAAEISNSSGDASEPLAAQQILKVIDKFNEVLKAGHIDALPRISEALDEFAVQRFNLIGATLSSTIYTKELLGTHDINALYKYKSDLNLTNWEDFLLFRTIVEDYQAQVCPGWYWFRDLSENTLGAWLFHVVSEDGNQLVRERALDILRETAIRPASLEKRGEIRSALLQDSSESIRKAFLKYLQVIGDDEDLPAIISASSDKSSEVRKEALRARMTITARADQNDAFSLLLGSAEDISDELLKEASHFVSEVNEELLVEASQGKADRVRAFALKELRDRNRLTNEMALKMREDISPDVRAICYQFLLNEGNLYEPSEVRKAFKDISSSSNGLLGALLVRRFDPDEIVLEAYRKLSLDQLTERADWYELDGHLAYKAISLDYFSQEGDRIRSDLKDGFRNYKEKTDDSYRHRYGSSGDAIITSFEQKDLNSFIRSQFTVAALAGLAKNGEPADLSIARDHLNDSNDNVILEAVRIVEQFGDASDVATLLTIARDKYGKLKESSANAALKLSPGPDGATPALLDIESSTLASIAIKSLWNCPVEEVAKLLEPFLSHKSNDARLKALVFFSRKLSAEKQEELLKRYVSNSAYYYNVVCWLDRTL